MRDFICRIVEQHHRAIQIVFLLLGLAAIAGLTRARIDNDHKIYFAKDNPYLLEHERLQDTFSRDDSVTFVLVFSDQVFTSKNLKIIQQMTEAAWNIPGTLRVDSLANFMNTTVDGDELQVEPLVSDVDLDSEGVAKITKVATTHPAIHLRLVAKDRRAAVIALTVAMNPSNPQEAVTITAAARELAAKFERSGELEIAVSGSVPANASFTEASEKDMGTLFPLMFLVMFIFIFWAVGSLRATAYTLYVVFMSALMPMGILCWLDVPLNTSTAIAPLIIITVAIADSIHVQTAIRKMLHNQLTPLAAVKASLQKNYYAVLVTSLTTAIGFLGLNIGEVPPFRQLGNIAALGVIIAFLASILVLPAMVISFGLPEEKGNHKHFLPWGKIANLVINRRYWVITCFAVLVAGLGALIPQLKIQDNLMEYFGEQFEFRRDADLQIKHMQGYDIVEFTLEAGEAGGVFEPAFLTQVGQFKTWAETQPHVIYSMSILPTLMEMNQRLHQDDPQHYRLPTTREEASQYFLLYEMSLPFGRDVNNQIDIKRSKLRVSIALDKVTNRELITFVNDAGKWLADNFTKYSTRPATGVSVMFANLYAENTTGMLLGILFSFILITLTLMFVFRSIGMGLLSLLPNIFPSIVTFGVWYLIKGEIGLIGSTVTALTLGIVVDDTVHFLSHFLNHRRSGLHANDAIRQTFESVGDAILSTSVILALGFAVLGFSGFQLNEYLGKLCVITIMAAFILDILFFPALLSVVSKDSTK